MAARARPDPRPGPSPGVSRRHRRAAGPPPPAPGPAAARRPGLPPLLARRPARARGPGAGAAAGPAHRFPPHTFESAPGEKFCFQFGEGMRIEELPAGCRVIYPGVRSRGTRDRRRIRRMIRNALNAPLDSAPLRERLLEARAAAEARGARPKVVIAFDDVSVPLPPMQSPDIRSQMMEEVVAMCDEEGVEDVEFICSIALHRPIRPDEFRHICGRKLFRRFFPAGRMTSYNAVDMHETKDVGRTRHGEEVLACRKFVEADLAVYVNVNYVSMDGGYKSYATGMVHYRSLKYNHDCKTLKDTRSLYDPARSSLHRSIDRIGRVVQREANIFHIETVLDENLFPWYLDWIMVLERSMSLVQKLFMHATCLFLRFLPTWLRKWIFWSPLTWAPSGLLEINAGETTAVHARTLAANYRDKVVEVDGQADVLIVAPSCIGPYTKDMYFNPLLVNTYSLGYYYNMYVDGTPLLREGGVMVLVNPMEYRWSPGHQAYKEFFEEVVATEHGGLDDFERFQEDFATNERLNDLYRAGAAPAAVHGFYMYTWAAHGMQEVGKVIVAGVGKDGRGAAGLGSDTAASVTEAVAKARAFLGDEGARVTYWRAPPIGYARVSK